MTNNYFKYLVCPYSKQNLYQDGNFLITEDRKFKYPIIDGIPSFINKNKIERWDEYYKKIYHDIPNPPHPYYRRFAEGWETMLDLGCGDGTMSAGAAYKVKDIYCVDPSLHALRLLKKRNIENMYPVNALGEYLPFRDNFFDGVFNIFVIEHLSNPYPMLKEIHRVLKPTGELVIATDTKWFYEYLRILFEWKDKGWKKWKSKDPTHINLMVPEKLRRILKRTNFKILQEHIIYLNLEKIRFFVQWLPKRIWDSFLSTTFLFICKPEK